MIIAFFKVYEVARIRNYLSQRNFNFCNFLKLACLSERMVDMRPENELTNHPTNQ